jgi:hypothetical protein
VAIVVRRDRYGKPVGTKDQQTDRLTLLALLTKGSFFTLVQAIVSPDESQYMKKWKRRPDMV